MDGVRSLIPGDSRPPLIVSARIAGAWSRANGIRVGYGSVASLWM